MKQSEQHDFLIESLNLEFKTIKAMVVIYCRDKHQSASLCDECEDFLAYAHTRLDRCPYGGSKPTCKLCPIHCYKADYKARSKEIMRYAGPKMLFRHPYLAIRHLMAGKKEVEPKPPANASNRHMRVAINKINS
ncbi:nitrous oxide-stimulated promoter family protein [Photobacterium sanctipauli]|uniref:Nitrous oxide-stimulated promoter family protein n=1 Tax=Photobacterium sanctipauli TaxID=1342794 RepID=A0A2T3NI99_9GAMM|nr:nitrous oxide-stimulated promoter family protein [Photobacterium sanctipauli]PSW14739.1 nitrous oxide-stimulated promoter family protein [Photobacterium sanctipauli]